MISSGTRQEDKVPLGFVDLWIIMSTWCVASGWVLSLVGLLSAIGYSGALVAPGICVYALRSRFKIVSAQGLVRRLGIRGRSAAPKVWVGLTLLIMIGGVLYHPSNYDYLTYRFPRILYWVGEGHWYWIPTINGRMNISATGMEWLMVPLFALFHTDRLFFLINAFSYLLLPGLVFSVFRQLGISTRLSWWWMWILPCGYCFVVQAASAGNDCFAAVYALASLSYLLRIKAEPRSKNIAFALLSAGLLTGAKLSNVPLLLPLAIAALFVWKAFWLNRYSFSLLSSIVLAVGVSALPMAFINGHFAGDYTGDPGNLSGMRIASPIAGVYGNTLQLATGNLAAPVWPREISWDSLLPLTFHQQLLRGFPRLDLHTGELQIEEEAGVGVGIVVLLLVISVGAISSPGILKRRRRTVALWVAAGTVVALSAYMAKMGSESTSRLLAAYYPFLIAAVLVVLAPEGRIARSIYFRSFAFIAMISALPLIILSPARPLFPVKLTIRLLAAVHVSPTIVNRFSHVYGVYANRSDAFRVISSAIPATEGVVGLVQRGDDPVASLWRPFGTHTILEVPATVSLAQLKSDQIHYLIISQDALEWTKAPAISELMAAWSGHLVAAQDLLLKVKQGPEKWYLVNVPP